MPLLPCPECGREISTAAEACPQCGHPNRPSEPERDDSDGPKCYACSATATTRCVSCGKLSCALHLNPVYVTHGRGGAYELRCSSCYDSAMAGKVLGFVVFGIVAVFILIMWTQMGR
jgi:hypothetical protein